MRFFGVGTGTDGVVSGDGGVSAGTRATTAAVPGAAVDVIAIPNMAACPASSGRSEMALSRMIRAKVFEYLAASAEASLWSAGVGAPASSRAISLTARVRWLAIHRLR